MKWYTRSCERPSKSSRSARVPPSVSNRYSFSTGTHGNSRRCRASSSPIRVCSFSRRSSSSRAAAHSSRLTTSWSVIMPPFRRRSSWRLSGAPRAGPFSAPRHRSFRAVYARGLDVAGTGADALKRHRDELRVPRFAAHHHGDRVARRRLHDGSALPARRAHRQPRRLGKTGEFQEWLVPRLFIPSGVLTLLSGVLLVFDGPWSFGDVWILIGLVGWVAAWGVGFLVIRPQAEKMKEIGCSMGL